MPAHDCDGGRWDALAAHCLLHCHHLRRIKDEEDKEEEDGDEDVEDDDEDDDLSFDVSLNIRLGKVNYEDDEKENLEKHLKADDIGVRRNADDDKSCYVCRHLGPNQKLAIQF